MSGQQLRAAGHSFPTSQVPKRASGQQICWILTTALSRLLDCSGFELLNTSKTGSLNIVEHVPQNILSMQLHDPLLTNCHIGPASFSQWKI